MNETSSFWSSLETLLKAPQPQSQSQSTSSTTTLKQTQINNQENDSLQQISSTDGVVNYSNDELVKRLNGLKSSEPFQNRLDFFEEIVKLSELFNLNENLIELLLRSINDMFKCDLTPIGYRLRAFDLLIELYKKRTEKFNTFMLKNYLLSFIVINTSTRVLSQCLVLNALYPYHVLQQPSPDKAAAISNAIKTNDDIYSRFALFCLISNNGNSGKNLDPELTNECLKFFLENARDLSDKNLEQLFELFKNIIANSFFHLIDEQVLALMCKCILNFSFTIANEYSSGNRHQLNKTKQQEIRACVELIEKLIEHLMTKTCINYIVLCLCELLDVLAQNQQLQKSNDPTIQRIYDCMNKLFVSPIGNCAIFTFFQEIFSPDKKYQTHKIHQMNGALMHIKQIFDDFKQSKLKNTYLVKELHLKCLISLPNALKSCCSNEMEKSQRQQMFENILNLTIDLVHLANHRDLFMCLLTLNSRKFLIEIINRFAIQALENDSLIRKYADLLNLLDTKEVFSYKTSSSQSSSNTSSSGTLSTSSSATPLPTTPQQQQNQLVSASATSFAHPRTMSMTATTATKFSIGSSGSNIALSGSSNLAGGENLDDPTWIFYKFKSSFYELVYKFPHTAYLKETCINNCIDFYLNLKLLPHYGNESIRKTKALLDKYFSIKNKHTITVRKFLIESFHKKLKDYFNMDQKIFTEDVIKHALLPSYEASIVEDDAYYKQLAANSDNNSDPSVFVELLEMKSFIAQKLIELTQICQDEENMLKIISLFEKIISMEETSSAEKLLGTSSLVQGTSNPSGITNSPQMAPNSSPPSSFLILNPLSATTSPPPLLNGTTPSWSASPQCLNYLYKIITSGLIDVFERLHFSSQSLSYSHQVYSNNQQPSSVFSRTAKRIFDILVDYLNSQYTNYTSIVNLSPNQSQNPINNQNPSSLSAMAAERLTTQQPQGVKYFNYYATIRKEILDFLLRVRSDRSGKVLLVNKLNRRRFAQSKHLHLSLQKSQNQNLVLANKTSLLKCEIDFGKILSLLENCLDKEVDWNVLNRVLADLPYVLQYEMNLIKDSDFTDQLFKFFFKKEISTLKNKPDNLTKADYVAKFYPLIGSLILYHPILDKNSQEIILQNFALGITQTRNRFCLEILTIAITEMYETNSTQCGDILTKLSHITPSQHMAQPILELLSTISDLKKLDSVFGKKEFIAVAAIAIKYTDPLKYIDILILCKGLQTLFRYLQRSILNIADVCRLFKTFADLFISVFRDLRFNTFIILLAHYVICIWFLKCKQEYRKSYASFTCKGLYQEVISQLDHLNKSMSVKDSKSPNKPSNPDAETRKPVENTANNQTGKTLEENKVKNQLTDGLKVFYRELVEITMDFMSNNMFFNNAANRQLNSMHNKNEHIVDIYANNMIGAGVDIRSNSSLFDSKDVANRSSKQTQTRQWIVGNKIIQITTGLFSNICAEEPSLLFHRSKHRTTGGGTASSTTVNSTSTSIAKPATKPIFKCSAPIPIESGGENDAKRPSLSGSMTKTNPNSSQGSSQASTANNSYSSVSMGSMANNTVEMSGGTTAGSVVSGKEIEGLEESSSGAINNNSGNFDGASSSSTSNQIDAESASRRSRLIKRRYKSGLPMSSERGDEDSLEEAYLRQFCETSLQKVSKDDSALVAANDSNNTASNVSYCCLRTSSNPDGRHHHHHHHHSQSNSHHSHHPHHRILSHDEVALRSPLENGSPQHHHANHHHTSNHDSTGYELSTTGKELCQPNCWCNNLVEITCRYPTKVVNYVVLVENNCSTTHAINMCIFENLIKLNSSRSGSIDVITGADLATVAAATFGDKDIGDLAQFKSQMQPRLSIPGEIKRNSTLTRISESSGGQDLTSQAGGGGGHASGSDTPKSQNSESSMKLLNPNPNSNPTLDQTRRSSISSRKSSLDLTSTTPNAQQLLAASARNFGPGSTVGGGVVASSSASSTASSNQPGTSQTSLDPSQVFLQLFGSAHSYRGLGECEQPILIPNNNDSIRRTLNILDYLPCYLTHKIGVIYIGANQANDEKAILANANGSARYRSFVKGLGNLVYLRNMDTLRYYPGGMETDGSLGDFTLLWYDGIVQVLFHVTTMMVLKDDDTNSKKRHIGNDSCLIVYNESGEEYQFGMIKGEVNCICIEIIPLKANTNIIKVKTTSELAQSSWLVHSDPKFVSDQNLALIVRKMALHADLAAKVFQKDNVNLYGGKWYERLKKINRIKTMSKEHYAKQMQLLQQQQQQQQMRIAQNLSAGASSEAAKQPNAANLSSFGPNQAAASNLDFTDYI